VIYLSSGGIIRHGLTYWTGSADSSQQADLLALLQASRQLRRPGGSSLISWSTGTSGARGLSVLNMKACVVSSFPCSSQKSDLLISNVARMSDQLRVAKFNSGGRCFEPAHIQSFQILHYRLAAESMLDAQCRCRQARH
jgi:hypothetical protein